MRGSAPHPRGGRSHGTATCEARRSSTSSTSSTSCAAPACRDKAEARLLWQDKLGDFRRGRPAAEVGRLPPPSRIFASSAVPRARRAYDRPARTSSGSTRAHHLRTLDGTVHTQAFDTAVLLPPFTGVGLAAVGRDGRDLTPELFNAAGFMKVDADYTARPYEDWRAADWPRTYQNPTFPALFAVGIAFAPPHAISRPRKSVTGTVISPAPPRTGMPSASMARAVAESVVDLVLGRSTAPTREASMAEMGAACVASAGHGLVGGSAAAMTMYPIVPDLERYPLGGRDPKLTFGEVGTAGHWIKLALHYLFLYKAHAHPLWWLIPE
ncbi:MAG: hypothetical protein R3F59_21775 [Myxococcota bacterium]